MGEGLQVLAQGEDYVAKLAFLKNSIQGRVNRFIAQTFVLCSPESTMALTLFGIGAEGFVRTHVAGASGCCVSFSFDFVNSFASGLYSLERIFV